MVRTATRTPRSRIWPRWRSPASLGTKYGDTISSSLRVRYGVEPMTALWLRLWRGILGVLVPEHLL